MTGERDDEERMLRAPGARSGVWKSPPEGSASTAELVLNVLPVLRLFKESLLISKKFAVYC